MEEKGKETICKRKVGDLEDKLKHQPKKSIFEEEIRVGKEALIRDVVEECLPALKKDLSIQTEVSLFTPCLHTPFHFHAMGSLIMIFLSPEILFFTM